MLVLFSLLRPSEAQQQSERLTTGRENAPLTMRRVILKNIFLLATKHKDKKRFTEKQIVDTSQGNRMDAASGFTSGPRCSASTRFKKRFFWHNSPSNIRLTLHEQTLKTWICSSI